MKIIVPMAGMGKRMRPHTLTIPKPLLPVAGKPIVQRLVEDIARVCDQPIEEIAFVIGDFGKEVEDNLLKIAAQLGAKGSIYYQEEALGTAHAILCAKNSLSGNVIVAFADTLFRADFKLDASKDGIIWVQKIENPADFGVVTVDNNHIITGFVEKPATFVSDLAIIGIYYFKDGEMLRQELQHLIDKDIRKGGEYQLTDALENMRQKNIRFSPGAVKEWLDCGNKDATVYTNQRILELDKASLTPPESLKSENSLIIDPCFIGEEVKLENSVIGPHVSVGNNTTIKNSVISNSIVQSNTEIRNYVIANSMIGSFVTLTGTKNDLSIGDYTSLQSGEKQE